MTPPTVVYLPAARDDLDAAYIAYEQQQPGRGERFLDAFRDQMARVQAAPALFGEVYQDVRAAPLRRFPFVIYYRSEPGQVVVVAVQHGSRDWSSWQSRV